MKNNHETNMKNLYAIGECASIYHGANRLGGNSLLAAVYGAKVAACSIEKSTLTDETMYQEVEAIFQKDIDAGRTKLNEGRQSQSVFPAVYIRDMLAENMRKDLGIVRDEEK